MVKLLTTYQIKQPGFASVFLAREACCVAVTQGISDTVLVAEDAVPALIEALQKIMAEGPPCQK